MTHAATRAAVVALVAIAGSATGHAQDAGSFLRSIGHRVADKVQQDAVDKVTHPAETRTEPGTTARKASAPLKVNRGFAFTPAPVTLFQDDFADAPVGRLAARWITNGAGQVATVAGLPGRWLALDAGSTFKLAHAAGLPQRYTVEFDLVAAGDKAGDVGTFRVGFAGDNSAKDYLSGGSGNGALNAIALQFGNSTPVSAFSGASGHSATAEFRVDDYLNRTLHVSISVDGDQERVWLEDTQVLDSRMFDRNVARYLFLSAPWRYDHHAQILIGHVRIGGYAPAEG